MLKMKLKLKLGATTIPGQNASYPLHPSLIFLIPSREASCTTFTVFGRTMPGFEPTSLRHSDKYSTTRPLTFKPASIILHVLIG